MAFTTGNTAGPMADINVTPLVDVMLVLLIIFMITAPVLAHKVEIDLPQPTTNPSEEKPPTPISLVIKASGELYWNDEPMISAALEPQLRIEALKEPQPQLEVDAERVARYEVVANVLATAKNVGIRKIGFKNIPTR